MLGGVKVIFWVIDSAGVSVRVLGLQPLQDDPWTGHPRMHWLGAWQQVQRNVLQKLEQMGQQSEATRGRLLALPSNAIVYCFKELDGSIREARHLSPRRPGFLLRPSRPRSRAPSWKPGQERFSSLPRCSYAQGSGVLGSCEHGLQLREETIHSTEASCCARIPKGLQEPLFARWRMTAFLRGLPSPCSRTR